MDAEAVAKDMFSVSVAWNSALITSSAAPLNAGYRCSAPRFLPANTNRVLSKGAVEGKAFAHIMLCIRWSRLWAVFCAP